MHDPSQSHYRKLENAYAAAPINTFFAPSLKVSHGSAEVAFDVGPKMHHAAGATHGSVYFKALDDAAFFAANSLIEDVFVLTASFTVYLLRPVSEGRLRARGRVVHRAGRLIVAESALFDADGVEIARGSGTFMRSRIALTADVGYH